MFGFAFGLAFDLLLFTLISIAKKMGVSTIVGANNDWVIVLVFLGVWLGILAQAGLENAIKKYSKH